MQHFFVDASQVSEETIRIEGTDVNHMKKVLRMRIGEEVTVSDGQGKEYLCQVLDLEEEQVQLKIVVPDRVFHLCKEKPVLPWQYTCKLHGHCVLLLLSAHRQ